MALFIETNLFVDAYWLRLGGEILHAGGRISRRQEVYTTPVVFFQFAKFNNL